MSMQTPFIYFLMLLTLVGLSACSPQKQANDDLTKCDSTPRLPLKTRGHLIVDARNCPVRLRSVNWFGAESAEFVVGGLDKQPLARIVDLVKQAGFNSVRLPWSNELLAKNPQIKAELLTANPELQGKDALTLFDAVINAFSQRGLMIILDNHRSRADWCCDEQHGDGLWHTAEYPESVWLADWQFMVGRYRANPYVIAAELRNEIRTDSSQKLLPTWGDNHPLTDWRAAAMRGGEAVLAINPDLLIIVGGINYQEDLLAVREHPVQFSILHRLVYAAHDYVWWHSSKELFKQHLFNTSAEHRWGFVQTPEQVFTAPVYISEWGGCIHARDSSGKACTQDRKDFVYAFARYACDSGIHWAYWPLNGTQSTGYGRSKNAVETYGLLNADWSGYADEKVMAALMSCEFQSTAERINSP